MMSRDFVYWLQGFLEIRATNEPITSEQVEVIQNHLNLVFIHDIDPQINGLDPSKTALLDQVHRPPKAKLPPGPQFNEPRFPGSQWKARC